MTICSTFRVLIAFFLLFPLGAAARKRDAEAANVSEAEYEVFSAYISQSFVGAVGRDRIDRPISQIVIVNCTESDQNDMDDPDRIPPGGIKKYLRTEAPSLQMVTIGNFHRANEKQEKLAPSFHLPLPYELVPAEKIGAILKGSPNDWTRYYRQYPGAQGHMRLSRVGFSPDGKQALFYSSNWCGGHCASGSYVVMVKRGSEWKMLKEIYMWES
jgi:hypothetical protein